MRWRKTQLVADVDGIQESLGEERSEMIERSRLVSRRSFLAGGATFSATLLVAACGGSSVTPSVAPAATSPQSTAPGGTQPAGTPTGTAPATATSPTGTSGTASPTATSGVGAGTIASQIDTTNIKKGGHVSFGLNGDVTTFMPILVMDGNSGSVTGLVFETLTQADPDTLLPAPRLATKWTVAADNTTYTFTLKEGVTWHDGAPFTADDVKFTFDTAANPETGSTMSSTLIDQVAAVTVVNPTTVEIKLASINAPFLISGAGVPIMPKHLLGDVAPDAFKTHPFAQQPVGTGPFIFKERKVGEYVELKANPDYHQGAPALDQVIIKVGRDNTAVYQQLKTGEIDALGITPAFVEDAKKQPNLDLFIYPGFGFQYLGFNLDASKGSPVLQDVRVRQALCYAINRPGIVDKIENGLSEVAVGLYPSISWAYQPDQITLKYEYDPDKARAMLDEAGWAKGADGIRVKDGQRLAFTMASLAGSKRFEGFTAVIQENWQDIGVEMTITLDEFQAFIARLTSSFEYESFILGTGAGFDPDQTSMWATNQYPNGSNLVKYSNPKVDELLAQGIETLDLAERKAIYLEIQNLVLADMPSFITTFTTPVHGVNKRLKNYVPNAVDDLSYQTAHLWYVTDGK